MYKLRPSYLKNIISNPYNFFKLERNLANLEQVSKGIEREPLSYLLYEQLTNNTKYEKQVAGTLEIAKDAVLQGTCDILTSDAIIDIKNSIQDDARLINEYKYQLSAYCAIFNKEKAFLFVDSNIKNETNLNNCRLVEVPIISSKALMEMLTKVVDEIKHLDKLNIGLVIINQKEELDAKMNTYFDNLSKIKQLEKQNKDIEEELKNTVYENDKYSLHFEATRKQKRTIKIEALNQYETKWVITRAK